MTKVAILSFYSGINTRGVEFWAESVKKELKKSFQIKIFSDIFGSFHEWSNYDIIIPTNGRWQVLLCRLVTWFKGKPMVVFGHSGLGADDKWNLLCSPNVFIAFSTFQKNWAEKFKFSWTRVVKIPHAVDTKRFTPAKKKPEGKTVLCVATNTAGKRIDLVKRAADLISGVKFVAVGKGNKVEAPFDKMPAIYKEANVFCFTPNSWEAFGLVFLEAMASNLPVVTTNDSIRREIVGQAGILVDNPEDSKELSKAIIQALEKDWDDLPRKQAQNFSWDKIRIKYEELFRSLI